MNDVIFAEYVVMGCAVRAGGKAARSEESNCCLWPLTFSDMQTMHLFSSFHGPPRWSVVGFGRVLEGRVGH